MKISEMFKMCLGLSSGFMKFRVSLSLMGKVICDSSLVFGESGVDNNEKRITENPLQRTAKAHYL